MAIRDVKISLGGKERVLRFRLGAWAAMQDRGFPLEEMIPKLQTGITDFRLVLTILWAMLQEEHPAPSEADVGSWVDAENATLVVEKIGEAIRDAFPRENGKDPQSAIPENAGTGIAHDSLAVGSA